eukprot:scaffold664843_cov60-Prasinocladus_malaysianus.AAC.1
MSRNCPRWWSRSRQESMSTWLLSSATVSSNDDIGQYTIGFMWMARDLVSAYRESVSENAGTLA